jgi:hypothetical protein
MEIRLIILFIALFIFIIADYVKNKATYLTYIKSAWVSYVVVIGICFLFGLLLTWKYFQDAMLAVSLFFAWKFSGSIISFFKKPKL